MRSELVNTYGGSKATERGVDNALQWLAFHQEADGHWDAAKYGASNKVDTAVTGFALLALLGAGNSEIDGKYAENVKRAVAWLIGKQQANGMIFDQTDSGGHRGIGYPTAIATLALCEAAGISREAETIAAAQKAVDYIAVHQQGEGKDRFGWRYSPKSNGDISVSSWFIARSKALFRTPQLVFLCAMYSSS